MSTNLRPSEARVLAAATINAELSIAELSRIARVKYRTAHHILRRCRERELTHPYWLISNEALGYTDWCLFLSLDFSDSRSRGRLHTFLQREPGIAYAAELGGDYQYSVSYFGTNPYKVDQFLTRLGDAIAPSSFVKTIATRLSWISFAPTYLNPTQKNRDMIERGQSGLQAIDAIDQKILTLLGAEPDYVIADFARRLGMSSGAIYYRIKTLKDRGILLRKMLHLRSNLWGMYSFRILIKERGSDQNLLGKLTAFCRRCKNITALVKCLGAWDYEVNIELTDAGQLNEHIAQIQEQFHSEIQSLKSISELKVLRINQYPFTS